MKSLSKWTLGIVGGIAVIAIVGIVIVWLFPPQFGTMLGTIDVAGGDQCWNVPDTARNIFAKGAYLGFAAEFEISEDDFVSYCQAREWDADEIATPVSLQTYRSYDRASTSGNKVTISHGLIQDGMSHRGGFKMAFDRDAGKGYLVFAHH